MINLVTKTLILVFFASVSFYSTAQTSLDDILSSQHRTEENKNRDVDRHPKQVLEFWGLKPTDNVLEMMPGKGWYSEIVAPFVKDQGSFTAVTFATDNLDSDDKRKAFWSRLALKYREKMSEKEIYGKVHFSQFEPPRMFECAKAETIDFAFVVRALHIWDELGLLEQGIKSLYHAIRPGGTLGIVQHRANSITSIAASAVEGYMDERYVIDAIEAVGFKLVASSDINMNLKDTKDYPKGVYALPPTLAMGSIDRDKYVAIGESDRMTLKFIKPIK